MKISKTSHLTSPRTPSRPVDSTPSSPTPTPEAPKDSFAVNTSQFLAAATPIVGFVTSGVDSCVHGMKGDTEAQARSSIGALTNAFGTLGLLAGVCAGSNAVLGGSALLLLGSGAIKASIPRGDSTIHPDALTDLL